MSWHLSAGPRFVATATLWFLVLLCWWQIEPSLVSGPHPCSCDYHSLLSCYCSRHTAGAGQHTAGAGRHTAGAVGIQRALVGIQQAPVGIERAPVSLQWVLVARVAPGGEENHANGSPIRELELCPMVTMGNLSHQITSWLLTEDS